jgi:hypothetical protein
VQLLAISGTFASPAAGFSGNAMTLYVGASATGTPGSGKVSRPVRKFSFYSERVQYSVGFQAQPGDLVSLANSVGSDSICHLIYQLI